MRPPSKRWKFANKGESDIIAATVELTLARLDLKKYTDGDSPAELAKAKGEIKLKKKDLDEAKNKLESFKAMMKKGLKAPDKSAFKRRMSIARIMHMSTELEYKVKKGYDFERKTTEFTSKVAQGQSKVAQAKATARAQMSKATSEYEAAAATADIEQQQLKEFLKQKELTVLKAEQDGIVAYANDRYWDESSRIREGATVWPRRRSSLSPTCPRCRSK